MKKKLLLIFCLSISVLCHAITVTSTPGQLSAAIIIAGETSATIIELTVNGSIDSRDIATMRDSMPLLKVLDLSGVKIESYTGRGGTQGDISVVYEADRFPIAALYSSRSLTTVVLPTSLTSIGHHAFYNCSQLTSVHVPASVSIIEHSVFMQCSKLSAIVLPVSITSIANNLFYGCSKLVSIDIPESVISFGESAFENCSSLTSITIPIGVDSIGAECFLSCTNLSVVNYNAINCSYMGEMAMYGSVFYLCQVNDINFGNNIINIPPNAFSNCTELTTVTIPSGVLSISENAFYGCTALKTISIPASVTTIESGAFSRSNLLESIYANPLSPIDLSLTEFVFSLTNKNTCVLHVPIGSKNAYQSAFLWQDFVNIVEDISVGVDKNIKIDKPKITTFNDQIIIKGACNGENLFIYNLNGVVVKSKEIDSELTILKLPSKGVYIVKVGKYSTKIIN